MYLFGDVPVQTFHGFGARGERLYQAEFLQLQPQGGEQHMVEGPGRVDRSQEKQRPHHAHDHMKVITAEEEMPECGKGDRQRVA